MVSVFPVQCPFLIPCKNKYFVDYRLCSPTTTSSFVPPHPRIPPTPQSSDEFGFPGRAGPRYVNPFRKEGAAEMIPR